MKSLVVAFTTSIVVAVTSDVLLNRYPIIMSHDAATGDMTRNHVVADWAKTQSIGLPGQLDCGSRSFDYRPYYFNGELYAHHGGVKIDKKMKDAVGEVIEWCNHNPDELVILYVNSCDGDDGCREASIDLLKSMGVIPITDCSELNSMTVSDAKSRGQISQGGSLLSVFNCMYEAYDPEINCYGKDFVCYDKNSDIPWNDMKEYMQQATVTVPVSDGTLWMAQGHWQSTAASIVDGTLHRSSLLLDESKAGVNKWIADSINNNEFNFLNIIEVDNVCDNGPLIYDAIQKLKLNITSSN